MQTEPAEVWRPELVEATINLPSLSYHRPRDSAHSHAGGLQVAPTGSAPGKPDWMILLYVCERALLAIVYSLTILFNAVSGTKVLHQ